MSLTEIESKRKKVKIFSLSGAVLFLGIIVLVNFVASYLPIRFDSSEGNVYSISRGSKLLLNKLDDRLLVRIMFSPQLPPNYKLNEKYLSDLLAEYKRASQGKIKIEYFDPSKSPEARQEAIAQGVVPIQLDVRERDRREVKECFMGVAFLYGDKRGAIPLVQDSQNLEYEITVQIKKLIEPEKPVIGFTEDAGALKLSDKALQPLTEALSHLYNVRNVDLTQPIDTDIKALWFIGPTKSVDPLAAENIKTFLSKGGTLALFLDKNKITVTEFRSEPLTTELDGLLKEAGLNMPEGLVVDQRCDRIQVRATQGAFQMINVVDYPYIPVVLDINRSHPATRGIEAFTMPYCSPIEITEQKPQLTYTVLARSSENSYLNPKPIFVNPLSEIRTVSDPVSGPFNLGLVVEGNFATEISSQTKPGKLILFSSSRFINAEFPIKQSNYGLLMNLVDWSAQDEMLLQIRSKGLAQKPIKMLSDGIRLLIKILIILLLPILTIILGLIIWQRQKVRRALLPLTYREN